MKTINSLTNPQIRQLHKLHNKKYRDQMRKFLIEGYHLIEEAKEQNSLETVLITKEEDKIDGVKNILVSPEIISKLSQTKTPQQIIGVCNFFPEYPITGSRFLLLDDIQDPGNLGTLVRSALGFGIDRVILSPNSVDLYNDKFIRSTQGAIFKVKIIKMDILKAIYQLQNRLPIIGTSLNGRFLSDISPLSSYALVLGNEGQGINPQILNETDFNVSIEMSPQLESLNVAIAGSIIMYQLSKRK